MCLNKIHCVVASLPHFPQSQTKTVRTYGGLLDFSSKSVTSARVYFVLDPKFSSGHKIGPDGARDQIFSQCAKWLGGLTLIFGPFDP